MAKRAHHHQRRWLAVRAPIIASLLGLSLVACSEANGIQTSPPGTSASPTAPAASSSSPSASSTAAIERLVGQRYVEFHRVVAEVGAASNTDDPRLAEYATGAVLENLRGKLAVRRQSGTRLYGAPVPNVQSVSLSGDRATVRDCLDNSGTGLMDPAGNKLSVGRNRQETTATLVLADGAWKVSEITTIAGGGSC
jgi:hypothetical protein